MALESQFFRPIGRVSCGARVTPERESRSPGSEPFWRKDLAHLIEAEGRRLACDEVSAGILQGAKSRRACMKPGVVRDAVGTGSRWARPPEEGRDVMGGGSDEGNSARGGKREEAGSSGGVQGRSSLKVGAQ